MTHNFTAVDFETATYTQMICQIGIVVVRDNVIVERFNSYVQPPGNYYDKGNMMMNRISPMITELSPTFLELWPSIERYFVNTKVVCHNRSADEIYLHKNLDYYNIFPLGISSFDCTCAYYDNTGLEALCAGFGIEYDKHKHHDATYDAECCALFAIHMYNNDQPDWNLVHQVKSAKPKRDSSYLRKNKTLSGDILVKNLDGADPNNPFYDRKVVITGDFDIERRELSKILKSMGADLNVSISKNTNFVIIGSEPGPAKMEKLDKLQHDGFKVRRLYQDDLTAILSGEFEDYHGEKYIEKDLDFTIDHYNNHHISFVNGRNVISLKELYYGKNFAGSLDIFCIITGNLGACGDYLLYPTTNICVLSDYTLNKLSDGIKDETILYIQDYYNKNKAIVFDFSFISENEILEFCKQRCESCGDDLTLKYYYKYLNSRNKI